MLFKALSFVVALALSLVLIGAVALVSTSLLVAYAVVGGAVVLWLATPRRADRDAPAPTSALAEVPRLAPQSAG